MTSKKQTLESTGDADVNPNFNPELQFIDRPYIMIVEENQSLAPVIDIQLRETVTNQSTAQLQNELLVVSGSNYSSRVNIIRKGISIKDHITLD